jgi:hypothetical protein
MISFSDVLTLVRVAVGGETLYRTSYESLRFGAVRVSLSNEHTELRVMMWSDSKTVLELWERGMFVYACSSETPNEAFVELSGYVDARERARKAAL